jgi:uncharacterized protein (TIGR03435 family)
MELITKAFGVNANQVFGPAWLISETYMVSATMEHGSSPADLQQMLQSMLRDRFLLTYHRGEHTYEVYDLIRTGKPSGLKPAATANSQESENQTADPRLNGPAKLDAAGCPIIASEVRDVRGSMGPNGCTTFRGSTMEELAAKIGMLIALADRSYFGVQHSAAQVNDRTGLTGEFDFTLKFNMPPVFAPGTRPGGDAGVAPEPIGEELSSALERQLGLKLVKSHQALSTIVIDRVLKTPVEN